MFKSSSTFDLVRKCHFCVLNESTDNSQVGYVISTALHTLCSDTCLRHTPIDTLLQLKTNENIFSNETYKVTFGVKYTSKFYPSRRSSKMIAAMKTNKTHTYTHTHTHTQSQRKNINLTFDLDDLGLSKMNPSS